jgi:hypothetical protein
MQWQLNGFRGSWAGAGSTSTSRVTKVHIHSIKQIGNKQRNHMPALLRRRHSDGGGRGGSDRPDLYFARLTIRPPAIHDRTPHNQNNTQYHFGVVRYFSGLSPTIALYSSYRRNDQLQVAACLRLMSPGDGPGRLIRSAGRGFIRWSRPYFRFRVRVHDMH